MKQCSRASIVGALLLPFMLSGCVDIPFMESGPSDPGADRYEFHASEGRSRVFFYHADQKSDFPFEAYIDGVRIDAPTSGSEYLRAEIPAGKHLIQWKDPTRDKPHGDVEALMESGQSYFFRVSRNPARLENAGNAGRAEVSDKTLVLADPAITGRIPQPAATVRGTAAATAAKASAGDLPAPRTTIKDKLSELKEVYDQGLITKDEYDGKRKQLLEKWN